MGAWLVVWWLFAFCRFALRCVLGACLRLVTFVAWVLWLYFSWCFRVLVRFGCLVAL